MELKDVILSTLSEIDKSIEEQSKKIEKKSLPQKSKMNDSLSYLNSENFKDIEKDNTKIEHELDEDREKLDVYISEELKFLKDLRERILVLFEGFQTPNIKSQAAKIDLILNFFEYQLSVIDERIDKISL